MRRGFTTAARAGLIGLALLTAGCGWFGGDDAADGPSRSPFAGPLGALARGAAMYAAYDIYNVIPNLGPLAGGQPVLLDGHFPSLSNAESVYTVYFGANPAGYDTSFTPFFTGQSIYVLTPPGDAPGLVDVILRDTLAALDTAAAYDGYEYLDPFSLIAVDPDLGPLSGGTPVTILGQFSVITNIYTIAAADAAYRAFFDLRPAAFDASVLPDPIIASDRMYVITPPGDMPGLVDVQVDDLSSAPLPPEILVDGFEYFDDFFLTAVDPDQGPLRGGTQVEIIGGFPVAQNIAGAAQAYTTYGVYFGTNRAQFDPFITPVITSDRMYVITPRGIVPGFVDVSVEIIGTDPLDFRFITDGFEYFDDFFLTAVDPDQGPLRGGTQVEITGGFPVAQNIAGAAQAYTTYGVYFGTNRAQFDPFITPVITSDRMYVITPRGIVPGFVDVSVEIIGTDPLDFRFITDGFEYLDDFDIIDVIPDAGPLPGGQQVEVIGRFPIMANISTIAEAYSAYNVYFGANLAAFDATFDPVITSERMYVITPPGDMPGFVDVTVYDVLSVPLDLRSLLDGYEYVADIELTGVDPDNGFILGDPLAPPPAFNFVDTPVTLTGTFPVTDAFSAVATAADAAAVYSVYFGDRLALFDSSITPVITAENMYVLAPVGEDVGPVDVRVEVNIAPSVFSTLERAYRYYSMYIGAIIPNIGPLGGGNPVEIHGLFLADPVFTDALDAGFDPFIAAEQIYSVFFDANQALFDITGFSPITSASIDTINRVYVSNRLYVSAPPGDVPGFVDVIVLNDLGREPRAISDPLKYEYEVDLGIGLWIDATVLPNPVGKLPSGHLLVTITVSGTIEDDDATLIFIVPQGGKPNDPTHRIDLVMESITIVDGNTVWTGTNADFIDTTITTDMGNILTDGHAAIYIFESETESIIGLPEEITDRINPEAKEGRHFIIDTIPPRMLINDVTFGDTGILFFDPAGAFNSDVFTTGNIVLSPLHPFAFLPPGITATDPIPWDQSGIRRNQVDLIAPLGFDDFTGLALFDPSTNRAQIFYNTGSIANNYPPANPPDGNFPPDDLRFNLFVTFEDVDVYTTLGIPDDEKFLAQNEDAFNRGVFDRQVAGFGFDMFPPVPPVGDRDEGVLGDVKGAMPDDALVQWETLSSPPNILNITTTYEASVPDPVGGSGNLAPAFLNLTATWEANGGIEWTGRNLKMPIVFRGVDRAGNYFPRGDATNKKLKNWTTRTKVDLPGRTVTFDPIAGPLNLWWLVKTSTEFIETNIPASENTRNPNFKWQNFSRPDPEAIPAPQAADEPGPERLFNYRLWQVDPTLGLSREDARDGPYTTLTAWSGWNAKDFLTTSEINALIDTIIIDPQLQEGTWFLLVVIAADEAGNVEQWPVADLGDISDGDPPINVASNAGSKGNWRRWYVAPAEEVVETEVRPTFWHEILPANGFIDANETVLGNIEIVPLPARSSNEVVSVEFRVDVVPDPSTLVGSVLVAFELDREGQTIEFGTVPTLLSAQTTFFIPFTNLGDPITRQPVHYVFRATASVTDTDDREIIDSTPANFKFVVVDNVAKFIEGRGDEQPIKVQDRP